MKFRGTSRSRRAQRWHGVIGVVTILVVAIVGWIAYRANLGLPLQSRYDITVLVPNADRLIDSADVRTGGVLVGEVLSVRAVPGQAGGAPYARVKLSLNGSLGHVPLDSTVQVRPASVLGLTYVDLTLGHRLQTVAPGGTLPLSAARSSSDLTDLFQVFNKAAGGGFQRGVTELAYGLAGRGTALNDSITATARLLPPLTDVMITLASPATSLSPFLSAYASAARAFAPVSPQLADLVSYAVTTLGAVSRVRAALGDALEAAPGAESATLAAFRSARPGLDGLGQLAVELRPAGALLPGALDRANGALTTGAPALRTLNTFSGPLRRALAALDGLATDPNTISSLRKLPDLARPTNTVLAQFTPAQVHCNVIALATQGVAAGFGTLGTGDGPSLPESSVESVGALGEELQQAHPSSNIEMNPIPLENASQCQAGNEAFTGRQELAGPSAPTVDATRTTTPPPGVEVLARAAGLLKPIPGFSR